MTDDRAAWEFLDSDGNAWIVQFAVDGITSELLSPGDDVGFRFAPNPYLEGMPVQWVALEKNGQPVVAVGMNALPDFSAVPDLAAEPGEALCSEQENLRCLEPRSVRVNANGESVTVPPRANGEVGGIVVYNNSYSDNQNCESVHPDWIPPPPPRSFELGIYSAR